MNNRKFLRNGVKKELKSTKFKRVLRSLKRKPTVKNCISIYMGDYKNVS